MGTQDLPARQKTADSHDGSENDTHGHEGNADNDERTQMTTRCYGFAYTTNLRMTIKNPLCMSPQPARRSIRHYSASLAALRCLANGSCSLGPNLRAH